MASNHTIVVEHEIFGESIEVRVKPAPGGPGHDRAFASCAAARDYADRLSRATGWPVADLCIGA
jgi:hypothetical protein